MRLLSLFSLSQACDTLDYTECQVAASNQLSACVKECDQAQTSCAAECGRLYDSAMSECETVYCTSVLVLNQEKQTSSKPITINVFTGESSVIDFEFGSGTRVACSCSVLWHGEMWFFGGDYYRTQISQIDNDNCELKRIGDLPFRLDEGDCVNVNERKIVLCFDFDKPDRCHETTSEGPLGEMKRKRDAIYDHRETRIATNGVFILAVGSSRPAHSHAELLTIEEDAWHVQPDFPFHDDIYGFAMIAMNDDKFMLFGGFSMGGMRYEGEVTVATFDLATLTWSHSGNMVHSRHGHGVIATADNTFMVVGGVSGITEQCTVDENDRTTCVAHGTSDFGAETYFYYPELFTVHSSFCRTTTA